MLKIPSLLQRIFFSVLVICFLFSNSVSARMYQWVEPDTGTTQLSGKPPAWYRGQEQGPRVLVFEKGRLVDDTDIEVNENVQLELRRKAFVMAEQDDQAAREKLAKSLKVKSAFKDDEILEAESELEEEGIEEETASADEVINELKKIQGERTQDKDEAEQQMAERLKEMIQVWEDSQKAEAVNQIQ